MQSKDILREPQTTWAVVPNGKSNHEKRFEDIIPDRVKFVKLHDTHIYHLGYGRSEDVSKFQRSFGGSKQVGYLVCETITDPSGQSRYQYQVIASRDFIGRAKDYKDAWVVEQARLDAEAEAHRIQQEKWNAEYNRKKAIETNKLGVARQQADNTAETIKNNLAVLLGVAISSSVEVGIRVDGSWRSMNDGVGEEDFIITQSGKVSMPVREFQRLLNKLTEKN